MKKIVVLAISLLMAGAASAGSITVDYTESNHALNLAGSFSGTDLNHDGWLTKNELDAWTINYDNATLPSLNAIGSFDYVNNVWLHDALQWNQSTHDAFMTWNNWSYSVSTSNYAWQFATVVNGGNDVPEPGVMALLAIGLAGLALARRKASR